MKLENHLNALVETSVIQLELGKEFGGTGLHLEVELEKVFQLLWSLLYVQCNIMHVHICVYVCACVFKIFG